jgi:hypothetical protein
MQAQDILRRALANDSTASPDMLRQASHSTGDPARLQRVLGKLLRGGPPLARIIDPSHALPCAPHSCQLKCPGPPGCMSILPFVCQQGWPMLVTGL